MKKPGRHYPDPEIRVNITSDKTYHHHVLHGLMDWEEHVTSVFFAQNTWPQSRKGENTRQTDKKDSVQNNWPIGFKSVKVMKDRKTEKLSQNQVPCGIQDWILSQKNISNNSTQKAKSE